MLERYSDEVLVRFGELPHAGSFDSGDPRVGTGLVGTVAQGAVIRLQIRVDGRGNIEAACFKAYGCPSTIAAASLACDWLKGRTVDQAMTIQNAEIAEALDLHPTKIHRAVLAEHAVKAAVQDYRERKSREPEI